MGTDALKRSRLSGILLSFSVRSRMAKRGWEEEPVPGLGGKLETEFRELRLNPKRHRPMYNYDEESPKGADDYMTGVEGKHIEVVCASDFEDDQLEIKKEFRTIPRSLFERPESSALVLYRPLVIPQEGEGDADTDAMHTAT